MSEASAKLALLLLIDLVDRTRAAQREYFRDRLLPQLVVAKGLEAELDRTCRELRVRLAQEGTSHDRD